MVFSMFFSMFVHVVQVQENDKEEAFGSWCLRRSWSEVSGAGSDRSTGRGRRSSDSELPSTIFSRKFSPEGAPIGPSIVSGANDGAIHLRKAKRRVSFNSGDFEEKLERVPSMEPMELMEPGNSETGQA
jgi:hypothetical protein